MKQVLLVFFGGGLGSALRFLISKYLNNTAYINLPLGTFIVNSIGCLLIGLLLGLSSKTNILSQNQVLLLATGFCGGFTTFSTFAYENISFLKANDYLHFFTYTIGSFTIGLLATLIGLWLSKIIA